MTAHIARPITVADEPRLTIVQRDGFYDFYCTEAELREAMQVTEATALGLTGRTLRSLRRFFDQQDHRPSDDHWVALWAIANTMEAMANGTCQPKIHLAPVDPGVGKSQTVIRFAQELVADEAYRSVGMLVSVFTIEEAKAMANDLQDIRGSLCVMTSDLEANALGGAQADEAQILLTTQNRLTRLRANLPFASVTPIYYRGAPRQCRIWDESALPGATVTLSVYDLTRFSGSIGRASPELFKALRAFVDRLIETDDGATIDVPDFAIECGVSLYDLVARFTDSGTSDHRVALALRIINGQRVRVRQDGNSNTLLTFKEELPDDLIPMLVLDASGRVRETYELWQESRSGIEKLPEAVRDYSPLTVKVWKTSGSKSGWEKSGERLTAGIVATIATKPDEDWLVVVHKPDAHIGDLSRTIKANLPANVTGRVSFTTWGRHTGINEWRDVPNVILAGTLFYPPSHLTALHHLCANLPVEDGLASRDAIEQTTRGEHRHLILQALCRGRVRQSDGDRCKPMTAYVIASSESGIPGELERIFPGCRIEDWSPVRRDAKGKLGEAIDYLSTAINGGRSEVPYVEVYEAIGMDKGSFSGRIAKKAEWRMAIDFLGAEIVRGKRGVLLVRVLPTEEGG